MARCYFTCFATISKLHSVVTHYDNECCNCTSVVTAYFHCVTFCIRVRPYLERHLKEHKTQEKWTACRSSKQSKLVGLYRLYTYGILVVVNVDQVLSWVYLAVRLCWFPNIQPRSQQPQSGTPTSTHACAACTCATPHFYMAFILTITPNAPLAEYI